MILVISRIEPQYEDSMRQSAFSFLTYYAHE